MLSLDQKFLGINEMEELSRDDAAVYKLLAVDVIGGAKALPMSTIFNLYPVIVPLDTVGLSLYSHYFLTPTGWLPARADNLTTGADKLLGIPIDEKIVLHGMVTNPDWDYTPGDMLYLSPNSSVPTATRPSTSGHVVRPLGFALTATMILFTPSHHFIEIK